jgi:ATP-dependent helicase/nuclease subunit A
MEEFDRVTGFTGGLAKDADAERIRKVLKRQKQELKSIRGIDPAEEERIEREHIVPLKMEIYARAASLREAYDAFKRAEGLLDFEDLQRRALDLLDDSEVLAEYAGRFRHVLLDEAQDTNPVQMRLVERLVDGRNHLFAVGDVQQSIYGFRGASVGLFQALGRRADRPLSLVDNFRSRAEIIASVNEVGRRMWSGGEVAFEALAAKLPYPEVVERRVALSLYGQRASEETPGDDASPPAERPEPLDTGGLRVHEGAEIARWIRQAVEGGAGRAALQVFDRSTRSLRRARYGDFALLTRTRTHNPVFEQCLVHEGVPYVKDGGGGFFSGQEIADVVGALRVCLNPADELSLLAVLRSPMFGWGDADLVRLRLHAGARGLWSALRAGVRPERDGALADACAILAELRALRSDLAPSELIEHLLERTHYRAALLHAARGRGAVANLEKLVDFARSFGAEDGHDLRRFVERVERAERFLKDENDAPLSADDAVTLATIHGSKGLEWPVVFLPCLDTAFARRAPGSCYSAPDGALLVEPKDDEGASIKPFSHFAVRAGMAEREESEARRLFYVAMTRAREYLFLSGQPRYADSGASDGFVRPIEWLGSELGIREHGEGEAEHALGRVRLPVRFVSPVRGGAATPAVAAADPLAAARSSVRDGTPVWWGQGDDAAREAAQRIVERCGAAVAGGAGLRATTVTRLTYFHRCPRVYYYDLVLQIEEHPRARGKASVRAEGLSAVDLGSRVHELLEHADFAAPAGVEAERLAGSATRLPDGDREKGPAAAPERALRSADGSCPPRAPGGA